MRVRKQTSYHSLSFFDFGEFLVFRFAYLTYIGRITRSQRSETKICYGDTARGNSSYHVAHKASVSMTSLCARSTNFFATSRLLNNTVPYQLPGENVVGVLQGFVPTK
ncbi:hypothetical protein CDAR_550351 [Caerostris darwini]|uniref:Uncharacterized protein n=1 Tax=Caerostris darwini TaxID=1538125 RepID=A0AAV4X793_9ARAC|nr:hypothetical protein CDAR_550351 [Caerostris darwini]